VTVDTDLPVYDTGINGPYGNIFYGHSSDITTGGYELWSSLLEKAYALAYGGKSYAGIDGGLAATAMARILGSDIAVHSLDGALGLGSWSEDKLLQTIKDSIAEGKPLVVNTKSGVPGNIIDNHSYVPIGVDSNKKEVTLYNPHGQVETYSISYLRQSCNWLFVAK
jgi:Calpain family cysteine protease